MYLNYYNLKREPFNITPDPELLFLSPSHKEALAAVIYGVNRRKGFISIVGEVGVGKTTIIRSFLDRVSLLDKTERGKVKTIYIFNSNISFKALLDTIYQNLGCIPAAGDVCAMVNQLHVLLIDEYKEGRNVVLIIDEAQNMPVETLENLRMLSNLETSTDKLIQIVFSGQPEFEEKINSHALRQLKQRIAVRVKIMPLSSKESLAYIGHRLSKTLTKESEIFTRGALSTIVREAGGIPRTINILCDNCLVTSFGNQQKKVSAKVAREIVVDIRTKEKYRPAWLIPLVVSVIVAVGVLWWYAHYHDGLPAGSTAHVPLQKAGEAVSATENLPAGRYASRSEEQAISVSAKKEDTATHRVARKGDTLAALIKETYGSVDKDLVSLVRRNNPGIANADKIQEGQRIYFPARNR